MKNNTKVHKCHYIMSKKCAPRTIFSYTNGQYKPSLHINDYLYATTHLVEGLTAQMVTPS